MANAEAGSAYISIIPSMKGFDTKLSSGISDAVGKVGKVAAAAFAAVGAGAVAAGKMALDSYSDYEQLSGGIEKIFGSAAGKVEQYASQAYVTAGLSANDYMRQVSSFSASLKQSFGGDVVKAAERANMAMVDMSDNANVFGSNIEDIQNAYQGFAKQNYTMLDNLKLGYGGTKTEMERLISDANAWEKANGKAGDLTIDKFGDVVQAIHDVQEAQGIAGDTAEEASNTIAGSIDMAKAAWENWLAGLGNENVDMGKLTDQLLQAIETVAKNVGPRVKIIGERIVAALPQMAQMVGQAAYSLLREAFVGAWNMVSDALSGIDISMPKLDASGFDQGWEDLLATMRQLAPVVAGVAGALGALKVVDEVSSGVEALTAAIGKLVVVKQVGEGAEAAAGSVQLLVNPLGAVAIAVGAAVAVFGTLYATNEDFRNSVNSLASDVASTVQPAIDAAKGALQGIGDYLSATFGPAIQTAGQGLSEFAGNLGQTFAPVAEAASGALQGIADAVSGTLLPAFQTLATFVQPALTLIANVLASVLGPALQTVASIASTVFATAFTVAGSIISGAMQVIGGVVQGVVGTIETIIGVFVGLFTGDWSMAANGASSIMQGFSNVILGIFNALSGTLGGILHGIASLFTNIFNGVAGVVGGIFGGIAKTMGSKIDGAKQVVKAGLSAISGFFKGLHLELPRIKLPHFSLSGNFDLAKGEVPHISVSWYAKGGIAQHMAVLGEAGAEAIVPYTNRNIMPWANALSSAMDVPEGGYGDSQADVLAELRSLHRDVANLRVYIDKRKLVGAIAGDMDRELGGMARLRGSLA
ncbi:MAG: hypothetical protein LKG38_05435 [Atopobiaceae bacterium]|jgi:phage-related protein|nr:hypothetical protein [Atopobiaceae bacterium]